MIARTADKRHEQLQAEADQKAAEVEQARQGDALQQARHFTNPLVGPAMRDKGRIRTLRTTQQMTEAGSFQELIGLPADESESGDNE